MILMALKNFPSVLSPGRSTPAGRANPFPALAKIHKVAGEEGVVHGSGDFGQHLYDRNSG
jgi:hypothetical protein